MKLQHLAVIFILIVLPISLILGSYTAGKMQTLSLQISYDNKLYNATYDAVKAFQLNTIHSGESNIVDSITIIAPSLHTSNTDSTADTTYFGSIFLSSFS